MYVVVVAFLQGLYILEVDTLTNMEMIRYFPVDALPQDPTQRFTRLFQAKPKWTFGEISPYLRWQLRFSYLNIDINVL